MQKEKLLWFPLSQQVVVPMPSWEVSSKKPFGKSKRELEKVGIAIFTSLVEDNCSKSQRN